jgi:hypothetical protein
MAQSQNNKRLAIILSQKQGLKMVNGLFLQNYSPCKQGHWLIVDFYVNIENVIRAK